MFRVPAKESPYRAACLVDHAEFVIGAESANTIAVGIQLQDANWTAIGECGAVHAYLSSNSDGSTIVATAPSSGVAIGTDGLAIESIADKKFLFVSESNGHIDIVLSEAGVATFYLVLVMPDGHLVISSAITFA